MKRHRYPPDQNQAAESHPHAPDAPTPQLSAYLHHLGEEGQQAEAASHRSDRSQSVAAAETPGGANWLSRLSLGRWGYFLAAKLTLFWQGLIAFHSLPNLGFVALVLWPLSSPTQRRIRSALALLLALSLLYYDSWLPPLARVLSQAALLSEFNLGYLLELLARFINPQVVAVLLLVCAGYWLLARWIHAGLLVVLAMLGLVVVQLSGLQPAHEVSASGGQVAAATPDLEREVQKFFERESQRVVSFARPESGEVPFDLVFIHVCSLSWDDVRAVGLDQHPLWQRFDMLLTRFNAASSYSGMAAIHLLRANCGQQEHGQMYLATNAGCYLMDSLQGIGFTPELALNHDGRFDNFLWQIGRHGHLEMPPLSLAGLPVAQHAFNDTPVYSDLSVLSRWLEMRRQDRQPRVALYYNTISLHDGNHRLDKEALPNTLASYRTRLSNFLDETEAFMQKLEQSGQRAVVVMVPEHGGAVRGDAMQIAGLREIPTPAITLVPVGIRLVGGKRPHSGQPLRVDQPTSYLAIAGIIQHMLANSPFNPTPVDLATYLDDLQQTRFVAQNEQAVSIESNGQYYLSLGKGDWQRLGAGSLPGASDGRLSEKK